MQLLEGSTWALILTSPSVSLFRHSFVPVLVRAPCTTASVDAGPVPLGLKSSAEAEVFTIHCNYHPWVLGASKYVVDPSRTTNLLITLAGDGSWYQAPRTNWRYHLFSALSHFAWLPVNLANMSSSLNPQGTGTHMWKCVPCLVCDSRASWDHTQPRR